MNDEDEKLEERLRERRLPVPPEWLREKVLHAAHRRVWRGVAWRFGIAAAALVAVVVGHAFENAEIDRCRELLARRTASRAEREAEELSVALADMLDRKISGEDIRDCFRARLRPKHPAASLGTWRRRTSLQLDLSTQE